MSGTPCARPHRWHGRVRSCRPSPSSRTRGYLLPEVLCALAILGLGLLPLASVAVKGLHWLREQAALTLAMRVVAEAAEQQPWGGVPMAATLVSRPPSGLVGAPILCGAAPADAAALACVPGSRMTVVGLPAHPSGTTASRRLRAIALWLAP